MSCTEAADKLQNIFQQKSLVEYQNGSGDTKLDMQIDISPIYRYRSNLCMKIKTRYVSLSSKSDKAKNVGDIYEYLVNL